MSMVAMSKPSGTAFAEEFAIVSTLLKEHAEFIYRTAYGVTGSHQDAEDVLQTIFLRLVRRELPPGLRKNPQACLYRAGVNLSLHTLGSRWRNIRIEGSQLIECSPPPGNSPDGSDDELHRQLYEAVAQWEPASAQILILRYVHNKRDGEIARMLGISRCTVTLSRLRSRLRLKKVLRAGFDRLLGRFGTPSPERTEVATCRVGERLRSRVDHVMRNLRRTR